MLLSQGVFPVRNQILSAKHNKPLQELERRQPEMPCAAPFASLVPGSLALRLHRSFFHCPRAGLSCARPRRLLARCRGRFLADIDLSALQAAHIKVCALPHLLKSPIFNLLAIVFELIGFWRFNIGVLSAADLVGDMNCSECRSL